MSHDRPSRPAPGSGQSSEQLTFGTVMSHLGVIIAVSVVMGVLVAGLAVPFAGALGVGTKSAAKSMKNLPEELEADPLPQRTRVLGSDNKVIATFYDENRVNVKLADIAPIMRTAIVAIEDDRFYEHGALDVKGTLRAFLNNQASGSTQGGSSITQQMAKMTLLAQAETKDEQKAATDDTYKRKIQELRHAIAFEQNYSKDWILERYLNIAYFGDGTYGVQSAARHYFSKNAKDLTAGEAALLAGLVKNPVGYDPTTYPERAKARRDVVLQRMATLNKLPQAQAAQLQAAKLGLRVTPARNGCLGTPAPFFCDYVRRYLLADPSLGKTVADRLQLLNNGGLTIKTSIDLRYQRAADDATRAAVNPTDQAIGGLAMVEPGTGNVRAISQSRPMGRDKAAGQTFLNYVVDSQYGDANGFQAGSTFKVFVLASALEQGLNPRTSIRSPETVHLRDSQFEDCDGPYRGSGSWDPSNSTGSGTFNMYTGTQKSVNTFFAQLTTKTGICKPYALAKAMGVDLTQPGPDKNGRGAERVPSFVLGIADVSPLEMASAYATFGARGLHCENRPVTQILNNAGQVFKDYPSSCKQVMQTSTADTVNDILRGVMERGGFGSKLALDKPSAGKTGTINGNMAVWFNGYTPTMATAAMVAGANDKGYHITLNGQTVGDNYINSAFGSTVAGPMWADAMRGIEDLLPYEDFVAPSRSSSEETTLTMPDVVGKSLQEARQIIEDAGLYVAVGAAVASDLPVGVVASTGPAAGDQTFEGSTITLNPSSGPAPPPSQSPPSGGPTSGNGNGNGGGNGKP